jgi:ubiquinone/menaquinone biosynthesis C-methylase UbiE
MQDKKIENKTENKNIDKNNNLARYYDSDYNIRRLHRKILPYIDIDDADFALDVGCGSGDLAIFLADTTRADIVGIDTSLDEISQAEKKDKPDNVLFIHADAIMIPFPKDTFDFVYSTLALHHMPKLSVLNDIYRVLKPGKKVLIADLYDEGILGRLAKITEEASFDQSVEIVKKKQMIELLKEAGFKDIKAYKIYSFYYVFEARK